MKYFLNKISNIIGNIKNNILYLIESDEEKRINKLSITDDPNTWGMCCSENMAKECAQENRKKYKLKWRIYIKCKRM